jgi:hypothetical protein
MSDSVISPPVSYNIKNSKSIFVNNTYTHFTKANMLLTSSYVNNTPNSYYNEIVNGLQNLGNLNDLYTIGVLYKNTNDHEYDSQYTVTGSLKKFEVKNINEHCDLFCDSYFVNNFEKICSCVIIKAARREIEEEIGLSFDDICKPLKIIENNVNNKMWYSLIFHISQLCVYKPIYSHKIIPRNKELFSDIKKIKIQIIIIGSEDEIKEKLSTITSYRIGHEDDIIGITLCKFNDLHFN